MPRPPGAGTPSRWCRAIDSRRRRCPPRGRDDGSTGRGDRPVSHWSAGSRRCHRRATAASAPRTLKPSSSRSIVTDGAAPAGMKVSSRCTRLSSFSSATASATSPTTPCGSMPAARSSAGQVFGRDPGTTQSYRLFAELVALERVEHEGLARLDLAACRLEAQAEAVAEEVPRRVPEEVHEIVDRDRAPRLVRLARSGRRRMPTPSPRASLHEPRAAELFGIAEEPCVVSEVSGVEGLQRVAADRIDAEAVRARSPRGRRRATDGWRSPRRGRRSPCSSRTARGVPTGSPRGRDSGRPPGGSDRRAADRRSSGRSRPGGAGADSWPSLIPRRHTTSNGIERIGTSAQNVTLPARKRPVASGAASAPSRWARTTSSDSGLPTPARRVASSSSPSARRIVATSSSSSRPTSKNRRRARRAPPSIRRAGVTRRARRGARSTLPRAS